MFVVFEGIDGSGKTTISNRVAAELTAAGLAVKHLRAEGKLASAVAEGVREFGRNAQNLALAWQTEFLLYVARDVQLIHETLRPALATHDLVLADRFLYTPQVLGRYGRRLPERFTEPVLEAAAEGLEPDLVILVDVDPTLARARRKLRKLEQVQAKPPSRKGLSGVGLQHRLRRGYLELAQQRPERWVVLENRGSLEQSVKLAVDLIRDAKQEGAARSIARFRGRAAQATVPTRGSTGQPLPDFLALIDDLLEREPQVAAYLLGGLHGAPLDERRRALLERAPLALLSAVTGLDDDVSFQLRQRLAREYPGAALRSLGQPPVSERSWELWQELAPAAPLEALGCSIGSRDARAWQLRSSAVTREPQLREQVIASLSGLDDARAWQLRDDLVNARPGELDTSYELARAVAKSVTGLGSERAWELRRSTRKMAPVAALASLLGVSDPESWQWRNEALGQAPKVVMASLRGLDDERAWRLRDAVVLDCKEALDGLQGVDSEQAWALRERGRDVWPSTVVKSLGTLADGARGRALVESLLAGYPDNVSLLKHAASIALGLHRVDRNFVE